MTGQQETESIARPEPPRAVDALLSALDDLHHRHGRPSYRAIGRAIGCSHTTVSRVFNAHDRPSWELVQLIIRHLDGDEHHFRQLWYEARAGGNLDTETKADPPSRAPSFRATAWVSGIAFVATTIALGAGSLQPAIQDVISDVSQCCWGTAASVALWRRAIKERGQVRTTIALVAMGITGWSAGVVIWAVEREFLGDGVPSPGFSDIGFYLLPLFTAVGLAFYAGPHPRSVARWLPSCAIVVFSACTLLSVVVAALHHGHIDASLGEIVAIGYPVTDIVIAWWALYIARNSATGFWTIVALAFGALTLSDTAFLLVRETHLTKVPPGVDLGYIAGPILLLAAAVASCPPQQPIAASEGKPERATLADTNAAIGGIAACAAALAYIFTMGEAERTMTGSALATAGLVLAVLSRKVGRA